MPITMPMRVVAVSCKRSQTLRSLKYMCSIVGLAEANAIAVKYTAGSEGHLRSLLCSNVSGIACKRKVLCKSCPRSASSYTCRTMRF